MGLYFFLEKKGIWPFATYNKNDCESRSCGYISAKDCPYNNEKDCKFDKKHCHLIAEKRARKHNDYTNLRMGLFICGGILFYTFASIASCNSSFSFTYSNYVYAVISGISISIIAGAILAKVIDLPNKLKDYEDSFINALASNKYLKTLDENRLTMLRNDITEQLHKTSAPCMARGLIDIDQKICALLREPYYVRYRHSVICSKKNDNSDFIEKEHTVDYKLINPYGANKDATEFLSLSNLILQQEGDSKNTNAEGDEKDKETNGDAIREMRIIYRKDEEEKVELIQNQDFELKYEKLREKDEYYNMEVYLDTKNKKSSDLKPGIRIDFKDSLEVHLEYKIEVHKDDICFTKRMRHPVKNFRLDYSYRDMEGKLYGQIFGTEIKQCDISIKYPTSYSISLETFDWLLPDNGAIVVMLNNVK